VAEAFPDQTVAGGAPPERFNLRDLGGIPVEGGGAVRSGRLFRGGSLHRLEGPGAAWVGGLGLRLAIDLRTRAETAKGMYAGPATITRHLPIFEIAPPWDGPIEDPAQTLAEAYMWMLQEGVRSIAEIARLLADPESYPAVVYCAAGKDRTGITCALILRLVGVEPDPIVTDYALSEAPTEALRKWWADLNPDHRDPAPAEIYLAPAEAMRAFLVDLDHTYGSAVGYLDEIGLDGEATAKALAANLVES
jgi:protein-tyrosine phosphatase